jgi:DNA-binding beta-propeller fold protein YncE
MHKLLGFMTTIILFGVVGLLLVPSLGAEGGYSFLETWGTYGTGNGLFDYPHGITIDNEGNVYVADAENNRIQKFDSNGNFISKWGSPGSGNSQFSWPGGIAIDNSGNIYVAEDENCRIQKFDPNGNFITMWGTCGSGDGQIDGSDSIAIDGSGNVYVSDYGNQRIQKFDPNGSFITKWGSPGVGNGRFNYQEGIAIDNSDNVYVADAENDRIQKFDSNGKFITKWGTSGPGNGQFYYPHQIAIDNAGNVYVSEWGNSRIQKFGPKGAFITKWGTEGSGVGQFDRPAAIAVNLSRDVYVADARNNRIQVFSPDRFDDTPLDYWATPYIEVIYQAGYTTGYGGTTEFKPEYEVTREQMAVFILRALNDIPADGYCGSTAPFSDVPADWWSCKYVKRLVELGITAGIGGGLFAPEGVVTREQMAAFITRALDEVPVDGYCGTEDPFTDVPYSGWSCKYVKRLVELGVTLGIGEGLYGPGNPVTRAQMAVFLARAFLEM